MNNYTFKSTQQSKRIVCVAFVMMILTCKFTEVISDVETPVVGATVLHIYELYHPCSGRGNTCTCIYHCQNVAPIVGVSQQEATRLVAPLAAGRSTFGVKHLASWTSPPNDLCSKGPSTSTQIKIKIFKHDHWFASNQLISSVHFATKEGHLGPNVLRFTEEVFTTTWYTHGHNMHKGPISTSATMSTHWKRDTV